MIVLRIGDPHIKPSNIEEGEKLMHFINDKILEIRPDRIEILGDLFHTHGIIRLEVLEFWYSWLDVLLTHNIDIYVLVGNHDIMSSEDPNKRSFSALTVFRNSRKKHLHIVELPRVDGIYAYVPYCATHEYFIDVANDAAKNGAKVLVCHQTFDGSQYENGFFAPDGIDPKKIAFDLIISGHIHTRQKLNNFITGQTIIYPGTPKWDSASDANEEKGIWLYEHDDSTGAIIKEELIRTAGVVTELVSIVWKEGEPLLAIPSGCHVTIELIGSSAFIEMHKANLKGRVSIKTKNTDKIDRKDRQPGKSFPEFVAKKFETEMDRVALLKYMRELKIV